MSDSDIAAAIKDAFKQDPQLATASITVTVEKGVVTLSGNAPNAQTYNRAISVARSAPGVRPPVVATALKF
ncbi:MAG: BON domain-containing protein [Candidatus Competibacteraceae bacterium]|nr:BON domain-containing protein [Candidatus Competibacteraceae bacterium]